MKKTLLLASALSAAAMTAGATDSLKGFRIGANLSAVSGANSVSVPVSKLNENTFANGGDVGRSIFKFNGRPVLGLGLTVGYDFHKNFGLLFGYQFLGRRSITGEAGQGAGYARGSLATDAWALTAEGRLPLVDKLDLTARLGFTLLSNKLSVRRGNILQGQSLFPDGNTRNVKETQWGTNYGLGGLYHVNDCTDVEFGWEAITPWSGNNLQGTHYNRFYVGAHYKF